MTGFSDMSKLTGWMTMMCKIAGAVKNTPGKFNAVEEASKDDEDYMLDELQDMDIKKFQKEI